MANSFQGEAGLAGFISDLKKLMDDAERGSNATMTIDLPSQEIRGPDGGTIKFDLDPFRKHCLLNGLDDIGLTLRHADKIKAFEAERLATKPWLAHTATNA